MQLPVVEMLSRLPVIFSRQASSWDVSSQVLSSLLTSDDESLLCCNVGEGVTLFNRRRSAPTIPIPQIVSITAED
jgi:hypothetical protein